MCPPGVIRMEPGAFEPQEYENYPASWCPDGQVPGAAGAGPAAMPRDGGGVEEDAPRQEEEAEG